MTDNYNVSALSSLAAQLRSENQKLLDDNKRMLRALEDLSIVGRSLFGDWEHMIRYVRATARKGLGEDTNANGRENGK